MSVTGRQNNLFLAEDWRKVYQTFKNADFTSYDFENIRRVMISYLRENYPEDFNDYIESSEYLALIDLIAYLGQSLAFRIDVNARENFLELAERRESVLRLARMLSYNVKRNICASGLLKVDSISTTEEIYDSAGRNLQNIEVSWNDNTNNNWFDQYTRIINASMIPELEFGIPQTYDIIDGIYSEQYRFNSQINDVPIFPYTKSVDGKSYDFEVVNTIIKDGSIQEEAPLNRRRASIIYRDDQAGYGSNNTGWFMHFRQGGLQKRDFVINAPTTNQMVDVTDTNINDDDVWLYSLDQTNSESTLWTKIPAITGNNVIYNSIDKTIRSIYSVQSNAGDSISLMFGDGIFANLPKGSFRCYYRVSSGVNFNISPKDMRGIVVSIPYLTKTGSTETIRFVLSLSATVTSAQASESNQDVKTKAPATYYTQNRMITGEDYNLAPLAISQNIAKVKAVNRSSSGISRNFDLVDPTGKYSLTNSFCTDGVIYREEIQNKFEFRFSSRTEIDSLIKNKIQPITKLHILRDFYYAKFGKKSISDVSPIVNQSTSGYNQTTGYLSNKSGSVLAVGPYNTNLKYIEPGALVKIVPPDGKLFSDSGILVDTNQPSSTTRDKMWSKIVSVVNDGTANGLGSLTTGVGPIVFNEIIPTGSKITEVIPKFLGYLMISIQSLMIDLIFNHKNFGLRYSAENRAWNFIQDRDLDLLSEWGNYPGDTSGAKLDSSWLIAFESDGEVYKVTYRGLEYYFESVKENRFFFDGSRKIYDITTGKVQKDKISVLKFNTFPNQTTSLGRDHPWEIIGNTTENDGFTSTKAVKISFFDYDDDSVVDNPEAFDTIVNPPVINADGTLSNNNIIFFEKYITDNYTEDYRYMVSGTSMFKIFSKESYVGSLESYTDGQLFYFYVTDQVKKYNKATRTLVTTRDYYANAGRSSLYFHYVHNADSTTRIDPSASNIMDVYLLTRDYDTEFRRFIRGDVAIQPLAPSSTSLRLMYGKNLDKIKSISDEIIYHPVRYKALFGSTAEKRLQASFKIVKNKEQVITDNDIKTRVITAINLFFSLDNWDFGDTFFFSELSAFVINRTAPYISSFVIVPMNSDQVYGSLQQITSAPNEIFISSAKISDVEIIQAITAERLKTAGYIVTTSILDINSTNLTSSTNF